MDPPARNRTSPPSDTQEVLDFIEAFGSRKEFETAKTGAEASGSKFILVRASAEPRPVSGIY